MRTRKDNPTPNELSDVEYKAMIFIEDYHAARRRVPLVREVQAAVGLSLSATHDLLSRLVEYGYLHRGPTGRKRNLRVVRSVRTNGPLP
jgi:predicted transcriptional regulator of viral defense system